MAARAVQVLAAARDYSPGRIITGGRSISATGATSQIGKIREIWIQRLEKPAYQGASRKDELRHYHQLTSLELRRLFREIATVPLGQQRADSVARAMHCIDLLDLVCECGIISRTKKL